MKYLAYTTNNKTAKILKVVRFTKNEKASWQEMTVTTKATSKVENLFFISVSFISHHYKYRQILLYDIEDK